MYGFVVYAQEASSTPPPLTALEDIFGNVLAAAIPLALIVLFVFLMLGGIKYISSGDSPEKAAGARNTLTWAIYGMLFLSLAYLFIRILEAFTGVNLSEFRIFQP